MISIYDRVFVLQTAHTTYAMQVMPTGQLEHLYYGAALEWNEDASRALACKDVNPDGNSIAYDKEHPMLCLDNRNLEISGVGKGDFRQPFVEVTYSDGNRTTDFVYKDYELMDGIPELEGLPGAYAASDEQVQTLCITMEDRYYPVELKLYYSTFVSADCIVRSASVKNCTSEPVILKRLMSTQLDLFDSEYVFTTFHGDWTNEMNRCDTPVRGVRVVSASNTGNSSNHANPFVMLTRKEITETFGEGYGMNLVYSGNHYESAESGSHFKTRFISGINPEGFSWELKSQECFLAPQAVMTYSDQGYRGISNHMHAFVREHIVSGEYKSKERPILINSWEACYFKFNESKIVKLAKKARDVGIELFVLDDGWFGNRNDDTSSLGDWQVNTKKLPGGLSRLSERIHKLGMQFGIWVEPEMVNENSKLYRDHPDWAVKAPKGEHSLGRNQMILDLTRKEIRDNIVEQMSEVFSSSQIDYVKWDMNRNFSDCFSDSLPPDRQGEFAHRYILGLYDVMSRLTKAFPHILFEGCASGGNRFDLGILCYMPQIWASDNTDAICRKNIQNNYSYGYPPSVIGAHVSGVPNHQTLRRTSLQTRYHVACYGILGYECNLCDMSRKELQTITAQVDLYKKYRRTFQYGSFLRTPVEGNRTQWTVVSENSSEAVSMVLQELVRPNDSYLRLKVEGLEPSYTYEMENIPVQHDIHRFGDLVNTMTPIHIKPEGMLHRMISRFVKINGEKEHYRVKGSLITNAGIRLAQSYTGAGMADNTRLFQDFESEMYYFCNCKDSEQ